MKILSVAVTSLLASRCAAFGVRPASFAGSGSIARHESAATTMKANGMKVLMPDEFLDGIDAFGIRPTEFAKRDLNLSPQSSAAATIATVSVTAARTKGKPLKLSEPDKFLEGIDVFIFDCDGVIWRVSRCMCHSTVCPLLLG
jgi:hypothetical protein